MSNSAPMRLILVLVLATLSLALGGCKSSCRQLSERLCECALNTNEKTACVSRAGNAEGVNPPSAADEAYCKALLAPGQCDCRLISTPEGKIRCGLARNPSL
jgi:hypothetical protein